MQTFPTAKEYKWLVKRRDGNCLSFALGQISKEFETFDLLSLDQIKNYKKLGEIDISDAFIKKAKWKFTYLLYVNKQS